jgi:hypothetical protein
VTDVTVTLCPHCGVPLVEHEYGIPLPGGFTTFVCEKAPPGRLWPVKLEEGEDYQDG